MPRRSTLLIDWVARALVHAGVVGLVLWSGAALQARAAQNRALHDFYSALVEAGSPTAAPAEQPCVDLSAGSVAAPDLREWSEERRRNWQPVSLPESRVVGRLDIPDLDVSVMVFEGTDPLSLNQGVGRIEGTARPGDAGNIGIAGHRDGFFRPLRHIQPGMEVRLQTLTGLQRYRVEGVKVVEPSQVEELAPTPRPALTLVTCYPFFVLGRAPRRFVVRAVAEPPGV